MTFNEDRPSLLTVRFQGDVLIHVGPHKTGTTSIQTFLRQNYEALHKKGVLYPEGGRRDLFKVNGDLTYFHYPLFKYLINDEIEKANEHIEAIQSEIVTHQPRLVVISCEALSRRRALNGRIYKDLQSIFGQANRKWVAYLRRQDDLLVSLFTEQLKKGQNAWPKTILDAEAPDILDHQARLERMRDLIGDDALIVRSFEREKRHLVASFLDILEVEDTNDFVHGGKERQSASARAINFQRYFNALPWGATRLRRLSLKLDDALNGMGLASKSAHSLLSPKDRETLMARYHQSNAAVENEYFDGESTGLLEKKP